ncbi:MAG TPA: DUF3299 domain-containing protein [Steroidobacteraceae bacterium]|nr:DUF3299 domain-containing protein [Steroidobacteraceae bacterium]
MSGRLRTSRIPPWLMSLGGSLALLASLSAAATVPVQPPQSSAAPATLPAVDPTPQKPGDPLILDWETLLPADERGGSSAGPPPAMHDYLGEDGPGALQLGSSEVNPTLNSMRVKVPGYVVPLEYSRDGWVREFFLVPYVGTCIHVPPPPPDQMVFVEFAEPMRLPSVYDAVWIRGTLRTRMKNSQLASAAYTLETTKVEKYDFEPR